MADYFTSDHFKLLNKWKGQKRDKSNPDQSRAYEELKQAYEVTERWANEFKQRQYPGGRVDIRKRPTNQGDNFTGYNWARIYPYEGAPKPLAYTVGIDADHGFVVKIDTVGLDDFSQVRKQYLQLRGAFDNTSPFVAKLPIDQGLNLDLNELVEWSVNAVKDFRMTYENLVTKLDLAEKLSDEDLLKHFDSKPNFQTFRASWSAEDKARFCRLARAVHAAGLDWWHMSKDIIVRFGRKNLGSDRAVRVLGIVRGYGTRTLTWTQDLGEVSKLNRVPLTDDLVTKIEAALLSNRDSIDALFALETERPGLWPDQLKDERSESDEESEDDETSHEATVNQAFNRIYYGPPGTGKTYQLSRLLKRDYEQTVTSVSTEEWQRQFIAENAAGLTWWESVAAALHDLGGNASVDQLLGHPIVRAVAATKSANKNIRQTVWGALQYHAIESSETVKMVKRMAPAVFDKASDSTWHFAGDWKESCADLMQMVEAYRAGPPASGTVRRYSFVTFHQSYGYEEFVEGLRPLLDDDAESGAIRYEIRRGAFKELCDKARLEPGQRFAMVIDEINRGNISKIFGELITLIEPDKRDGAENAISVSLPYSGKPFSVPPNVDIIGTMNTADRSLALLDTALRRRFEFVSVLPDSRDEEGAPLSGLRVTLGAQLIDVPKLLSAINARIDALYDRDHLIGHAYFTALKEVPDGDERLAALSQIFSNRIVPLLEEYFFEDWQKIRLVLADNQKPAATQFIVESKEHEEDLARLFGSDHGLDAYSTKQHYTVRAASFSNPDAYIGIYQAVPT